MSRRKRNVARVKRMLDRCLASPHEVDELIRISAGMVIDDGRTADRFCLERGWSTEGICAVVMALAEAAPPRALARMAEIADGERASVDEWDAIGWYEAQGFEPLHDRKPRAAN